MEMVELKPESPLNSKSVSDLFSFCLFEDSELTRDENNNLVPKDGISMVKVKGITIKVGFHSERLKQSSEKIEAMLAELPIEFKEGWTFSNMCMDRRGRMWTGFQKNMHELMLLGMASKRIAYCVPRNLWGMLPDGMPYIQILVPDMEAPEWALGQEE